MTDVTREESETGKFSNWIHIKNWISDYFKSSDIDIDGNKYVSTNVKNFPVDFPSGAVLAEVTRVGDELEKKFEGADLNRDVHKNVGVNVKTITEEDPDAATKNNGSYSLIYNGNDQLWRIDYTIAGQTFRKTLTYTSGRLSAIGQWVKQ